MWMCGLGVSKIQLCGKKKEAVQSFENALCSVIFPLIYGSGQLL